MAGMGIGAVAMLILVPLCLIIGLFLGAAIIHVCLMLVGGANKSFETGNFGSLLSLRGRPGRFR